MSDPTTVCKNTSGPQPHVSLHRVDTGTANQSSNAGQCPTNGLLLRLSGVPTLTQSARLLLHVSIKFRLPTCRTSAGRQVFLFVPSGFLSLSEICLEQCEVLSESLTFLSPCFPRMYADTTYSVCPCLRRRLSVRGTTTPRTLCRTTPIRTHVRVCLVGTCVYTCVRVSACVSVCMEMCVSTYVWMCVRVRVCVYVYVCPCVGVWICAHLCV